MKIVIAHSEEEFGKLAFAEIREVIYQDPACTLGLATGSTPIPLYKEMVKDHQENGTSYCEVKTFNLDEYVGLPKEHPESYISFMTRNLFSHVDINVKNVNIPNGLAPDIEAECARYSALLEKSSVNIQVLGVGANGHIAFNEPGTPFDSKTHQVFLTQKTISDNARFFDSIDQVPKSALTMGIGEIMSAKKLLMLAAGSNKADVVYKMIKDPVDPSCPASILQKHPDVVIVLDRAAAAKL